MQTNIMAFRRAGRAIATVLLMIVMAGPACALARADNLDGELADNYGPKVMVYLQKKGYKNVGVLTFRFQHAQEEPSFSGTLINGNMADRLERALIRARSNDEPVNIIHEARKTAAARWPEANYRTPNDRKRLFDLKYELPLDIPDKFISADAFVTGKVSLSKNFASTTVTIECFDKSQPAAYTKILSFNVDTDRVMLADMGQGFSLSRRGPTWMRGISDIDIIQGIQQEPTAVVPGEVDGALPKLPGKFPVELTIYYDEQGQAIKPDTYAGSDNWTVADPKEGQQVTFNVRNTTEDKIGIVLTVNGINTVYEEYNIQPMQMTPWILQPGKEYKIKGFLQTDRQKYRPIVGLSEEVSKQAVGDLGGEKLAGLIHLFVFRKIMGEKPDLQKTAARGNLRAVPLRQINMKPPRTWAELQTQIETSLARTGSARGLMAGVLDLREEQVTTDNLDVPFLTDTMIIRYWTPPAKNSD